MILTRVLLASLALAPALALPAVPAEGEIFSFSQWVEGIISNPDGNNLTPEEAVAAWTASFNTTRADALEKRAGCWTSERLRNYGAWALAPDAVQCIDYLARKGKQGIACGVDPSQEAQGIRMAVAGTSRAWIWGSSRTGRKTSSNCNDVARAAGFIMDKCTVPGPRAGGDWVVRGSEYAYGNGDLLVDIEGLYFPG